MKPTKQEVDKDEIIEKVAKELNISEKEAKRIWKFQFQELSRHMMTTKENKFSLVGIGKVILKHPIEKKIDPLEDWDI